MGKTKWYLIDDVCPAIELSETTLKKQCRKGIYNYKVVKKNNKTTYFINKNSLPEDVINRIENITNEPDVDYSSAPAWAKQQAHKYIRILKATAALKGADLQKYINEWNAKHPDYKTSYPSIIKMRRRYKKDGIYGLLARYGHHEMQCNIDDEFFSYFKNLYLKMGGPSVQSCWDLTFGYAIRHNPTITKDTFPSCSSFMRKLRRDVPERSICLARKGETYWNRRYGIYINRDYSTVQCGKVWVSDHAQIDIACFDEDNNVVFPWVTAWRDYKSGKWLGWLLHTESPNSDHIFQTFYFAAKRYGLPEDVIIDNGKDYRCKDFAGGRRKIRIETNKEITTSMLDELHVNVNFALPYNAQTKPIERDFLKIKELLSKHSLGYRGGNVVERPEDLAMKIKQGTIMKFDYLKEIFDKFILNVYNRKPSQGKNLKGLCPDELFSSEFKEKIYIPNDALKLFCMRTSRNYTVGRNGIQDRQLGITYWSDWMIVNYGLKVYLRRDPENYKEAWAFKAENEEFVGFCTAVDAVAALHADKISKEEFKTALAIKKHNIKVTKSYIKQVHEVDIAEQYENYLAAYSKVIKEPNPVLTKFANTKMEDAIKKKKEMDEYGMQDLSGFVGCRRTRKRSSRKWIN